MATLVDGDRMSILAFLRRYLTFRVNYELKLLRLLRSLNIAPVRPSKDAMLLEWMGATGDYRLVLEMRGPMLLVLGISKLVMENQEMPGATAIKLLNRNVSLQGCAWAVLLYGQLRIFVVAAHCNLATCSTREFLKVLDGITCELDFARRQNQFNS